LSTQSGAKTKTQTKAEWLAEGAELGAKQSDKAWEIGRWLVTGENLFLPPMPVSKRKKRAYFGARKIHWLALVDEASKASGLATSSLRQYAKVWRRGTYTNFPELKFGHHIEVMRCHHFDEKGKRHFDSSSAFLILHNAKKGGWSVAQTRAEVSRLFPVAKLAKDALWKIKRIIDSITDDAQRAELLKALSEELAFRCDNKPLQPPLSFDEENNIPY
jgi:hypothetical protein